MVDAAKAYCPDCGSPMDEEQKRTISSEYDSLMKTQQLSQTTEFRLSEHFTQSSDSIPIKKDADKPNKVRKDRKTTVINLQPIAPETSVVRESSEIPASQPENERNRNVDQDTSVDTTPKSNKKFYIITGGVVLLFLFLALIVVVILGFLYWNNQK